MNQNNPLSTIVVDSVVKSFFRFVCSLNPHLIILLDISFNQYYNTKVVYQPEFLSYTMVIPIRHISIGTLFTTTNVFIITL